MLLITIFVKKINVLPHIMHISICLKKFITFNKNFFMKSILLSLIILLSLNSFAQNTDEQMIKDAMTEQLNAWNAGDIDRYMETYWHSDSLMFIGKSGPTYGFDKTKANYKKGYPDTAAMGKLDFEIISMKRLSVMYYSVVGKWHLKRSIGDIGGAFTLLFKKIKKKWVIIQDHSS
jgi:ketosteroid isomerase-like protein